ncbi:unnamed protein product [Arctogadus glacialis]
MWVQRTLHLTLLLWYFSTAHRERMAYHRGQKSIREAYDDCFMQTDTREVTFQRVVNIVERRTTVSRPEVDYSQEDGFAPDWSKDRHTDEDKGFLSFHRKATPPPQEVQTYYCGETRDDTQLRRQVEIRNRGRTSPDLGRKTRGRPTDPTGPRHGRGSRVAQPSLPYANRGQDNDGCKRRDPRHPLRGRSPVRRDPHAALPASHAGFEGRGRSFSPDRDNSYTYQQLQQRRKEQDNGHYWTSERSRASSRHNSSGPDDTTSHGSAVTKESVPVSVVGPPEVPPSASPEPSPAPTEDPKARRAQALTNKALEIEELYERECRTFGTVVKLLVEKRPSLEEALQAPLRANLLELKQRCLDDLKHFIKELDQLSSGGRAAGSPAPPQITA